MKNLRYLLIMLFFAPGLVLAQASSDTLDVVVTDGATFGAYGIGFGTAFEEDTNIGPLPLILAEPLIGCVEGEGPDQDPNGFIPALDNADEAEGNIVLIYRGSCQFATKVKAASDAGAAAVIIGSTVDDVPNFGGDCSFERCTIPATAVTMTVRDQLAVEAEFGNTVTIVPVDITTQVFPPPPSTVGTHNTGELAMSVYDYGFLGANASFAQEGEGAVPFTFNDVEGALFVSSFLLGQDGVVNTNPYAGGPPEFENINDVQTITAPAPFDEAFETSYSSEELGVTVTQRTYSRSGDAFVVAEFEVENTSGSDINDLYSGIFADWDVVDADDEEDTSGNDSGGVNEDLGLVYVFDETGTQYYGVTSISPLSGYNPTATTADDEQLFASLTTPVDTATVAQEYATVTGAGPFSIGAGTSATFQFAYVAGASEADLFANTEAARGLLVATEAVTPQGTYVLESAYPNPVTSRAQIGFELPTAQDVTLKVYDVLGREVATLVEGVRQAGPQTVEFDVASLPSGVYVYRLEAGSTQLTERMTIVR